MTADEVRPCEDCGQPGVSWEDGVILCDSCALIRAKKWHMERRQQPVESVARPPCSHDVDREPGWLEMAFLPEGKYAVQHCIKGRGWHVFHYDEQAAQIDDGGSGE